MSCQTESNVKNAGNISMPKYVQLHSAEGVKLQPKEKERKKEKAYRDIPHSLC